MPMTSAEFGKLVADETEKWAKVVKFANISVDSSAAVFTRSPPRCHRPT